MSNNYSNQEIIPLNVAGSTKFGRYPKINAEQTFNMFLSDGWLVSSPGYKVRVMIDNSSEGVGRRVFTSDRWGKMIAVIDNGVYSVDSNLSHTLLFKLNTSVGDVFIDENNNFQIGICDKKDIWVYNWKTGAVTLAAVDSETPLNFLPGYITYQDTYFISPDISTFQNVAPPVPSDSNSTWRLSVSGDGTTWPFDAQHQGTLQTKASYATAALRVPGRGNLLFVFGKTVTEPWYDVGNQLFPYQRNSTENIDYGCQNTATIATLENLVVWLGFNEKSGYSILYSDGGKAEKISTDGIDFRLGELNHPELSFGFLYEQYGHIFYQITFYHPSDNITYIYDFRTNSFFTLTDENQNFHIAKNVAFFNNTYYFVSTRDGNIYELNGSFNTYDYGNGKEYEIPRFRILPNFRYADSSYYIINNITFNIEQGLDPKAKTQLKKFMSTEDGRLITTESFQKIILNQNLDNYVPKVSISLSKDGGVSFGSFVDRELNSIGNNLNRLIYWQLGIANDIVIQIRFISTYRSVCANGEMVVSK